MTTATISEGTATTWSVTTITGRTIITDALRELGVVGQGETVGTNDANYGLTKLNRLIDQWWAKREYVHYREIVSFAFTTSKTSYTIGATGDFVGTRPVKIEKANLIRTAYDPDEHVEIEVYNIDEYFHLAAPATSGSEPTSIYYCPTATNGTIYPYPYPENTATALANKLELLTWTQLSKFSSLDTTIALVPGYEAAIVLTLAEQLGPSFDVGISKDLKIQAARAREILTSGNITSPKLSTRDYGIPDSEEW